MNLRLLMTRASQQFKVDQFDTDQAALDELLNDIEKQRIATFARILMSSHSRRSEPWDCLRNGQGDY